MNEPGLLYLWEFPERNRVPGLAVACGGRTFEQCRAMLTQLATVAQANGRRMLIIKTNVPRVLQELEGQAVACRPENCEGALRDLFAMSGSGSRPTEPTLGV